MPNQADQFIFCVWFAKVVVNAQLFGVFAVLFSDA